MTTPPLCPQLANRIAFYEGNIALNNRIGSKAECCLRKNRSPNKATSHAHNVNAFTDAMISPLVLVVVAMLTVQSIARLKQ